MVAFAAALAFAASAPAFAAPVSQTFEFASSPFRPGGTELFLSGNISLTFEDGETSTGAAGSKGLATTRLPGTGRIATSE
jgi:hypothetical protein